MSNIIASNETFAIAGDKRGEGTYGSVYGGYYRQDPSCQLAFKVMKDSESQSGLVQQSNIRELTFLTQMAEMTNL